MEELDRNPTAALPGLPSAIRRTHLETQQPRIRPLPAMLADGLVFLVGEGFPRDIRDARAARLWRNPVPVRVLPAEFRELPEAEGAVQL